MQEYVDSGKLAGITTLIMKEGKLFHQEQYGYVDMESKKAIDENTIFRIFSMTKPITAVALMTLYDKGKFELDDTGFFVPREKHGRLAKLYTRDAEGFLKEGGSFGDRFKKPVDVISGGGGLVSSMDDYLNFCTMLLNGGVLNGERVLQESTVKLIMSDQLPDGASYWGDNGYGLAGAVNLESGEYSWAGLASTNFWIDPGKELGIVKRVIDQESNVL